MSEPKCPILYRIYINICIKIYKITLLGDPLSLPAPPLPPPLRETIFSTEIRSVEYEKSEEQKETVLFDDIGESTYTRPVVVMTIMKFIVRVVNCPDSLTQPTFDAHDDMGFF